MDKYQLSLFEKLIRQELKQKTETQPQPDQIFYITTIAKVQEEKERILDSFSNDVFYLSDEKEIEWRVQVHQQKIILLSDNVAEQLTDQDILNINAVTQAITWTNLYKILYTSLIELLLFIETTYTSHLNQHAKVPVSFLLPARQKFECTVPAITETLTAAGINEQLLTIILQPFHEFLSANRTANITYHGLVYLKTLMDKLSNIKPATTEETDINKQIQSLLLAINFNSTSYYEYCTATIKKEVATLSIREQLERLIWMQKQINQIHIRPGFIYNPLQTGLQQQLQLWLAEEINYLKEIHQLSSSSHSTDEILRWKGFKVLTQYSVSQLGNILRLLVDSGVYLNQNKTELLEFYAYFYASVKQENISPASLRKNFYIEDAGVTDGVRSLLIQLLNQSKKG
jgi:hypothetical protein